MFAMAVMGGSVVAAPSAAQEAAESVRDKLAQYTEVRLEADLSSLTESQRRMIVLLIEASEHMSPIFWEQAWGDPEPMRGRLADDQDMLRFFEMNYGPWDRLGDSRPFVPGIGARPPGGNLYPSDATRAEVEAGGAALTGQYTMVRRRDDGELFAVPYREAFAEHVQAAAAKLREAAELAVDAHFRRYLELRAEALLTDEYQESDFAWMDMKDNAVELIIGPIESYEDQLLGVKAAHEAYLLLKDLDWSARLARYAGLLPGLQRGLPVPEEYRSETPGAEAELNAYDLLFAAGDGNTGSKSIAVNLPNDEEVQLRKGTRRLQIKNVMRAKFERILSPIAVELIDAAQRDHVTFDAFFENTMFHEVAHGLGIKNTVNGSGTVREAMREQASWLEEGKADILGLYMIRELHRTGELEGDLRDNMVTFFASIFRSIRFGATSAHGRANLVRFNFFAEHGAFHFDESTGTYAVDFEAMGEAVDALSRTILTLQGDGDRDGAAGLHDEMAVTGPGLERALQRLGARGIPVDLVYRQGAEVLGLR